MDEIRRTASPHPEFWRSDEPLACRTIDLQMPPPRVAVLGGGFQGVCLALELAQRGARITIFERQSELLLGAATAAEGKVHLGYVYAADTSLRTARTMLRGARVFLPLLSRWLGADGDDIPISSGFLYLVHRDSSISPEHFADHLAGVAAEAAGLGLSDYFGRDATKAPRRLSREAADGQFGDAILAAFETPEVAVDMIALAVRLRQRIADDPLIDVKYAFDVSGVEDARGGLTVRDRGKAPGPDDVFDHVVNALWDGRIAVDATRGLLPARPWIHRFKYGMRFRPEPGGQDPLSTTIVHGPFGDSVSFPDGSVYLSWYPACMIRTSHAVNPDWPWPSPEEEEVVVRTTLQELSGILPGLGLPNVGTTDVSVKAGTIVAWGDSDIGDVSSELHQRHDIGVHTTGTYHSVDPGKLTMVPFFALDCADRILGH